MYPKNSRPERLLLVCIMVASIMTGGCSCTGSSNSDQPGQQAKTPTTTVPDKVAAGGVGEDNQVILAMKGTDAPTDVELASDDGSSVSVEQLNKAISRQRENFSRQDRIANNLLQQWSEIVQRQTSSVIASDSEAASADNLETISKWQQDAATVAVGVASITWLRDTYRDKIASFRYPLSETALQALKTETRNLDDQLETALEEMQNVIKRWSSAP